MADIDVTVIGTKELAARLRRMGEDAHPLITAALQAGALKIQNAAKANAPKRTRTLSRSIVIKPLDLGPGQFGVTIGPTVEYGKYVEYGTGIHAENGQGRKTPWVFKGPGGKFYTTSGMKARPYMRPAFDDNREAAIAEFQRVLKRLVAKSGGTS